MNIVSPLNITNPDGIPKINIPSYLEEELHRKPVSSLFGKAEKISRMVTKNDLEIFTVSPESIPRNGVFIHILEPHKFQILLKSSLTKFEMIIALIFELANVLAFEKYDEVFRQAYFGRLTKSGFALKVESIEFRVMQTFYSFMKSIKSVYPEDHAAFPQEISCKEDYLRIQEQTGHTKEYENVWEKQFSETFYAMHPWLPRNS
jgi:hypothetical protein